MKTFNGSPAVAAGMITPDMARELAVEHRVCVRPLLRRVIDQATGDETKVAIPCGSTRETVCPSCADKARRLRIQQCAEGWHRADEPDADESVDEPDSVPAGTPASEEPTASDSGERLVRVNPPALRRGGSAAGGG